MYILIDTQNGGVQIGTGKLKADLNRGLVGDVNSSVNGLRTFEFGGTLVTSCDLRVEKSRVALWALRAYDSVMPRFQRLSAATGFRAVRVAVVAFSLFPFLGVSCSPKSSAPGQVKKVEEISRAELLKTIESSRAAREVVRNKSHYVFGRFFYLGGMEGIAVLPMGDNESGDSLLLIVPFERLSFLGSDARADHARNADARCGDDFLFRISNTERVAVATEIEKKTSRKFGLFSVAFSKEMSLCRQFENELAHTHEEWTTL